MDKFCVATFFSIAVSVVMREINDPDVTESKNPTSWARMFVNRRFRSRATTLYEAVLNMYIRSAWNRPPKRPTRRRPMYASRTSLRAPALSPSRCFVTPSIMRPA